jgi:hypothetical protein
MTSTMPTQKVFKQRVRARMAKTGESYTAARSQLLRKSAPQAAAAAAAPAAADPTPESPAMPPTPGPAITLVSDEAMVRATGRTHAEWFALLDAWGATDHSHTEIARWVHTTHDLEGWWAQNVTVAYERARGLRGAGQMADGYSVTISRTFSADSDRLFAAFLEPAIRERWLPGASIGQRPTKAARTRRFDWTDPPSRLAVNATLRPDGRTVLGVTHERLPDPATAERLKVHWRERLAVLAELLAG